jgi:ankyrin repeat protein
MSRLGAALDLAHGKYFTKQLLYVQHVDKKKDTASTISEQSIWEYFLRDSQIFSDPHFSEYMRNPKANVGILKSFLEDKITHFQVYSNSIPILHKSAITFHAFVVFQTENSKTNEKMWYSMEKNGFYIILQQSPVKIDVTEKIYEYRKTKQFVKRPELVKLLKSSIGNDEVLENLLRAICETNQLNKDFHLLFSNCHHFASFVCEISNFNEGSLYGIVSDYIAKGKYFTKQLLYVQHVDKEKNKTSIISEESLREYFLGDSKTFTDFNFSEYLRIPKANVGILKSSLEDKIINVEVYSNPLSTSLGGSTSLGTLDNPRKSDVAFHAFVVIQTENPTTNKVTWYSIEKNREYIVLQQSPNKNDVTQKIYNVDAGKWRPIGVERLEPVEMRDNAKGNCKNLEDLLGTIWETNQLNNDYHLLISNCQNFASFVFEKSNLYGKTWSTPISSIVDQIGFRKNKIKPGILAESLKYKWIEKDDKKVYYKAMMEGRRKDFEELAGNLTTELLNSVDSQGYTLLEWATVFSTSDWLIDQFLREKGAKIQTDDEGLFRRNVFFIALQYLPLNKESRYLSFDGINIHGVNQTGDTALHLALYGGKWDVAEKILKEFSDDEVNATNYEGDSPFGLTVQLECKMVLMKKILAKTNKLNVNKPIDEYGRTALHYAIKKEYKAATKKLLNRDDVNVTLKNKKSQTALHFACFWKNMPIKLFRKILEKSAQHVNALDKDGNTALHWAIQCESKIATKELLRHKDVKVNLNNKDNRTAFDLCSDWKKIPANLLKIISDKTAAADTQAQNEAT